MTNGLLVVSVNFRSPSYKTIMSKLKNLDIEVIVKLESLTIEIYSIKVYHDVINICNSLSLTYKEKPYSDLRPTATHVVVHMHDITDQRQVELLPVFKQKCTTLVSPIFKKPNLVDFTSLNGQINTIKIRIVTHECDMTGLRYLLENLLKSKFAS